MATNFPSGLDSYTTKIDNVDSVLAAHVNDLQSAISALEAKVGVDSSAVSSSIDYKIANISSSIRDTFTDGDLSAGILTVTHNKSVPSPYVVSVQVFDNNGVAVIPDEINTFTTNSFKIDLTSYGTLSGTWSYIYAS